MESQEHNENLENYFRKRLEEATQSGLAEDWNNPSPEVWTHIQEEFKPRNSKRIVFYQRAAILLLLLLLFLTFYQNHQQEQKIGELSERLESYEESLHEIKSELSATPDLAAEKGPSEGKVASILEEKIFRDPKSVEKAARSDRKESISAARDLVSNNLPQNEGLSTPDFVFEPSKISITHYTSDGLRPHPIYLSQLPLNFPSLLFEEEEPIITRKQSFKGKRNYVRLLAGPTLSSSDMIVLNPDRNQLNFSYVTGVQIGRQLNKKLSLELGVQYFKLNIESRSFHLVNFNRNQETLTADGLYESSFSFELPGLESMESTELVVSRAQDESIADDTALPIEILTENSKSYLQIPLVLQYSIDINKFRIGLRGGILNSFRLDNKTDISALSLEIEDFNSLDIKHRRGPRDRRRDQISYRPAMTAGLGIEYNFNDRVGLVVQPTYERDFDKSKVRRNKKIYSQSLSINSGLVFTF